MSNFIFKKELHTLQCQTGMRRERAGKSCVESRVILKLLLLFPQGTKGKIL